MTTSHRKFSCAAVFVIAIGGGCLTCAGQATAANGPSTSASAPAKSASAAHGTVAGKTAAAKATRKGKGKGTAAAAEPVRPVQLVLPEATAEQIDAAGRVFYGVYECEFQQTISIDPDPKYASYVDLRHGKTVYIMKPVLSSTGAIRLEDMMADTLMVQISSKSMLLNVNTGHRLVDDCVSPGQRAAIEAARLAKSQAAADTAAPAASAATANAPADGNNLH